MAIVRNLVYCGMFVICGLPRMSVGESSSREPWWVNDPCALEPRVHATYEVPGGWKATVYTRLWPRLIGHEGEGFQIENTLCYVEVTDPESQTSRRVWQHALASATRESPDFVFHDYALGPVDEERFCLAVVFGASVIFAVVDARDDLPPAEDSSAEAVTPTTGTDGSDKVPHVVQMMPLRRSIKGLFPRFHASSLAIDAVSCCGDLATIHLHQDDEKAVLRFSLDAEEPQYEVYLVTTSDK